MQHPLVNPSLAPYGFVFPASKERLEYKPTNVSSWVNTEALIARLWAEVNRADAPKPLPVVTIIHEILPGQATANRLEDGDFEFDGLPFLSRDIALISSFIQWFGTSVGGAFLEGKLYSKEKVRSDHEFLAKYADQVKRQDILRHLVHTCTPKCQNGVISMFGNGHDYRSTIVTDRDKAVVDGLMRWLGRTDGRAFIAKFLERNKRAWAVARKPMTDAIAKAMAG